MSDDQEAAIYNAQLADGLLYQDFVTDALYEHLGLVVMQYSSREYQQAVGESRTGVEIKHDKNYSRTGNLYIETGEKARPRPGDYWPSGIYRKDNAWLYAIGSYDIIFLFSKRLLQAIHLVPGTKLGEFMYRRVQIPTSAGFLLPDATARKYAAAILTPRCEQKVLKAAGDLGRVAAELHAAMSASKEQMRLF